MLLLLISSFVISITFLFRDTDKAINRFLLFIFLSFTMSRSVDELWTMPSFRELMKRELTGRMPIRVHEWPKDFGSWFASATPPLPPVSKKPKF